MHTQDDIRAKLQKAGLRATPQRLELLHVLHTASEPLGIAELQERSESSMDTTTFYRGLETLVEAGLVRRVDLRHGHADYEIADDHHHHLVCSNCARVEDVAWCPAPATQSSLLKRSGFSAIQDHAVEFFGLCNACA